MSQSTKTTFIIAIIIFSLALVTFMLMVFQVDKQGTQLSEKISILEAESAQEDSFFRLQRISEETSSDREELRSHFLASESNSIDFLNLVEDLAPRAGVSLETNSLDIAEDEESGEAWIQTSFSFSASRSRVENFLKILENLPYVLRIDSYSMDKKSGAEWTADVTMKVQVLDYDR
jgi:hypothetical protein